MLKKLPFGLGLSLLILLGFFTCPTRATTIIEPPTLLNLDGLPVTSAIPKTTNRTPTFVGHCNFPFASMDYEMRSHSILGTGRADQQGLWQWVVPQKLDYGLHALYVTATDSNDSTNTEASIFQIEVVRTPEAIAKLGLVWFLAIIVLGTIGLIISERLKTRSKTSRRKK